jgi:hypothetical protein
MVPSQKDEFNTIKKVTETEPNTSGIEITEEVSKEINNQKAKPKFSR